MLSKASAPSGTTPGEQAVIEYAKGLGTRIEEVAADTGGGGGGGGTVEVAWTAADSLFSAWSFDPQFASATAASADGTLYVERCKAADTDAINAIRTAASAFGASMTLLKVAVFDAAGVQLGVSANAASTFAGSSGTVALAAPTRALVVGETLFIAIVAVGGTPPTMRTATAATPLNYGLAASDGFRSATLAAQTDMPSSLTLSGLSSNTARRWMAAQHA